MVSSTILIVDTAGKQGGSLVVGREQRFAALVALPWHCVGPAVCFFFAGCLMAGTLTGNISIVCSCKRIVVLRGSHQIAKLHICTSGLYTQYGNKRHALPLLTNLSYRNTKNKRRTSHPGRRETVNGKW